MKVEELILRLKSMPPDAEILRLAEDNHSYEKLDMVNFAIADKMDDGKYYKNYPYVSMKVTKTPVVVLFG